MGRSSRNGSNGPAVENLNVAHGTGNGTEGAQYRDTRSFVRISPALSHPQEEQETADLLYIPYADAYLVLSTVTQTPGVRESGGQSLGEALRPTLRERRLLLVLDNCEHVWKGLPARQRSSSFWSGRWRPASSRCGQPSTGHRRSLKRALPC